MRSEVLTAVKMSMLVFWVVTPCGETLKSASRYSLEQLRQHFESLKPGLLYYILFLFFLVGTKGKRGKGPIQFLDLLQSITLIIYNKFRREECNL
jgi:hypothetical protein